MQLFSAALESPPNQLDCPGSANYWEGLHQHPLPIIRGPLSQEGAVQHEQPFKLLASVKNND